MAKILKWNQFMITEIFNNQKLVKNYSTRISEEIRQISPSAKFRDTLTIVKNNFYSPIMNGDYDLKTIIKAIPSDVSYEEKDNIAGGNEAQLAWFIYTDPKTSNEDKEKQVKLLKAYCAKDTLAIYYLIKYLLEQSKKI